MKQILKYGTLAVVIGVGLGVGAQADDATGNTNVRVSTDGGGLKIASADGNFAAELGGRVQIDGYLDGTDSNSAKIGSGSAGDTSSDVQFRRVWLSLAGHVYGYQYHIDYDFVSGGLFNAWVGHDLLSGGTLYLGQRRPWGSLDDLASNANTPFLERNITSDSGVYTAVSFSNGLYYRWRQAAFTDHDNLWLGASVSSLHNYNKTANSHDTQGTAYNARVAYAPYVGKHAWAHVGVSFTQANADTNSTALAASYVYGNHFDSNEKLTLVSYGVPASGGDPHSDNVGAELAGAYGPLFLEGEYVDASFHQDGQPGNTLTAYSVTAAYALTGETRAYDKSNATYGGIKPLHDYGAVELAVRYDHARNDGDGGFVGTKLAGASAPITQADVSLITVGLNYYVNRAVRFSLDYEHGRANLGQAGEDSPNTVGARAQLLF